MIKEKPDWKSIKIKNHFFINLTLHPSVRILAVNLFSLSSFLFGQSLQKISFFNKIISRGFPAKKLF